MILLVNITKEQKEALLSFYPDIKKFVERTISDTADRIIIERDLSDIDKELTEYHGRRTLNRNNIHGRKCTQATKDKISKAQKGKHTGWHQFPETKRLIGLAHKGKIVSQATRDKVSKANKGKKRTEEQRKNISLGHKGMKNRKHAKAGLN